MATKKKSSKTAAGKKSKKPISTAAKKKVSKRASSKISKKSRTINATKKVTKKVVKKATKKVAKKVTKKATKKVAKKTTKKTTKKAAKKVTKKTTRKATKKVTKKAVKKTPATKTKKITKKVSRKPAVRKPASSRIGAGARAAVNDSAIHGIAPYKERAREKYMNPKQVEHFRAILLGWKDNLLDEVSKTIHLMQDENINHPDPNDRASQETDMSLELRNRDRERKLLKKIDSTILRLDSDDYGWCDRCGVEIGIRRLEARPTAELCVDCKTLNEIKERQMI